MADSAGVIVVGAGHNGLVAAATLAQAGRRVLVLEGRGHVGGAAATVESWPGVRIDLGGGPHLLWRAGGLARRLSLERYGYEELPADPWLTVYLPGGGRLALWRDAARTRGEIARHAPADAARYADFLRWAAPLNRAVAATWGDAPGGAGALRALLGGGLAALLAGRPMLTGPGRRLLTGYGQVLDEFFDHDGLKGALAAVATVQGGLGPDEVGGAGLAARLALFHGGGAARPRGGGGALSEALARCVVAHGGMVRTGAAVASLLVEGGRVVGVALADGAEVRAPVVLAALPPQVTLGVLLPAAHRPAALARRVAALRVTAGLAVQLHVRASEAPALGGPPPPGWVALRPSLQGLRASWSAHAAGRYLADGPLLLEMPTALDASLAPAGEQVVSLLGLAAPYAPTDDPGWARRAAVEAGLLAAVDALDPAWAAQRLATRLRTPPDMAADCGLPLGNWTHVDATLHQAGPCRPLPELAAYGGPLPGLYLTGAAFHPGPGVSGLPGALAARRVLREMG